MWVDTVDAHGYAEAESFVHVVMSCSSSTQPPRTVFGASTLLLSLPHQNVSMDPGFSSNDPRTQSASSGETDLCRRGRYQESGSRIQDLTHSFLDDCTVQNELALACLFQDNFGKLLHLVGSSNGLGTRQASFNQLLLDYGRLHVDLILDEAVKSSQQVWEKWINGKPMEEYDDIDVSAT